MKILLVMLLICSVYELPAQIIQYDYRSALGTPIEGVCIRKRANPRYQIININTFARKVEINGRLISINTDAPAEIESLFRLKTESVDKSLNATQEQVNKMDRISNKVSEMVKAVPLRSDAALEGEKTETATLVTRCLDYYRKANEMKGVLSFQKKMAGIMANKDYYNPALLLGALDKQKINASSITELHNDFDEFEAAYDSVYRQYGKAANAARNAKNDEHADEIKNAQNQVQAEYDKLEKEFEEALNSIDNLFAEAANPDSYIVTSEPIHIEDNADEVEFEIRIGDAKEDLSKKTPFVPKLYVNGGLKIDYSVGAILKFISDDEFYLDNTTPLKQTNKGNVGTLGVASMVHLYRRACKQTALGGMFGINADFAEISDVNVGVLGGASLIFGRSRKAFLSVGVNLSKVNRLRDERFEVDKIYEDIKIDDVTRNVLRPSLFVSFSLSLTKRSPVISGSSE